MKYTLKIIEGANLDSVYEILDNATYEIRRLNVFDKDKRSNVIYLDSEEVSKLHAKLFMIKGSLIIHDLNSTNGIFVNNKKVSKTVLVSNDIIRIGDIELKLVKDELNNDLTFINKKLTYKKLTKSFKDFLKNSDKDIMFKPDFKAPLISKISSEAEILLKQVKSIIDKSKDEVGSYRDIEDYFFEVNIIEGNKFGDIFKFYRREIIIGRAADLIIDDDLVSKEHVKVSLIGKNLFKVEDLNSINKTYINNKEIRLASLSENDILRIGNTSLKFKYLIK